MNRRILSSSTNQNFNRNYNYNSAFPLPEFADKIKTPAPLLSPTSPLSPVSLNEEKKKITSPTVNFQSDTDGRNNFLDQRDFHAFCKQRDLFYAIKESWTPGSSNNNVKSSLFSSPQPGNQDRTNFEPNVGKIRHLFNLNSSPSNLSHFASLFTSQYILDSLQLEEKEKLSRVETENDQSAKEFQNFFNSNPSKFKQLTNRICPIQNNANKEEANMEFQLWFIKTANSHAFNQYLIDFLFQELEQFEIQIDQAIDKKEILEIFKKSKWLAQLLGKVYFHPYHDPNPKQVPKKSLSSQIEAQTHLMKLVSIRSHQRPPIPFVNLLSQSLNKHRLIFTFTWIIEFFTKADNITFHLPHFKPVFSLIYTLYQEILNPGSNNFELSSTQRICDENKEFLKKHCERIINSENFPLAIFEKMDSKYHFNLKEINRDQQSSLLRETEADESVHLDFLSDIGKLLLPKKGAEKKLLQNENENLIKVEEITITSRECFENKNILDISSNPFGENVSNSTKKPSMLIPVKRNQRNQQKLAATSITPKAQKEENPPKDNSLLENELELSFFQNYPTAKKVVEYISSRVASNFVKMIRKDFINNLRVDLVEKKIFDEEAMKICREKILQKIPEFCPEKCEEALKLLIDSTLSESVVQFCQQITTRKCTAIIIEWVNKFITADIFTEIPEVPEIKRLKNLKKEEKIYDPVFLSSTFKRFQKNLFDKKPITEPALDNFLNEMYKIESILLFTASIDISITLAAFYPELLTSERQAKFIDLWTRFPESKIKILCPRNILIYGQSIRPTNTWKRVEELLLKLYKVGLIESKELEEESLCLLREEWPQSILKQISTIFQNIRLSIQPSEETEVMDWVAWVCSENEDEM